MFVLAINSMSWCPKNKMKELEYLRADGVSAGRLTIFHLKMFLSFTCYFKSIRFWWWFCKLSPTYFGASRLEGFYLPRESAVCLQEHYSFELKSAMKYSSIYSGQSNDISPIRRKYAWFIVEGVLKRNFFRERGRENLVFLYCELRENILETNYPKKNGSSSAILPNADLILLEEISHLLHSSFSFSTTLHTL